MTFNADYLAQVFNSTIILLTPMLFVTLTAVICSRIGIFNIGLEGALLGSAFAGIAVNFFTHNVWLAVIAAGVTGSLISFVVVLFIVKLHANPVVVGISMNTLMSGTTTFLMTIVFGSKGVFYDSALSGAAKITLPVISKIPILNTMLANFTILDYLAFISAILLFIFLYKTVPGYRLRAVGINKEAARSMGTNVTRFQIITITAAGFLAGLGGALLSLGSVVVFTQNISAGRGYIALVASELGMFHPLGAIAACALFGFSNAVANMLQNTAIKSSILSTIPYVVTISSLILIGIRKRKNEMKELEE